MKEMSFDLIDHFDPDAPTITADHMGDGMFVLTEALDDGQTERVCLTVAQISELFTRASLLYGTRADTAPNAGGPVGVPVRNRFSA